METEKLGELLINLGNSDITKDLETERAILNHEFESATDEMNRDFIRMEDNLLAKKIEEETEFQKKWR